MKKSNVLCRLLCMLLCGVFCAASALSVNAAQDYRDDPLFHEITAAESVQMHENGERFILYCYRSTCGNCRQIGGTVVTQWMHEDQEDVYGVDVDAGDGIPSWVRSSLPYARVTLPVVVFVQTDKGPQVFSGTEGLDALRTALDAAYTDFHQSHVRLTVLSLPAKTAYRTGEEADLTGLSVLATLPDGTQTVLSSGWDCCGFSSDTPGKKTIVVVYRGARAAFAVRVDSADGRRGVWIDPPRNAALDYGQAMTLYADTDNRPAGAELHWSYTVRSILGRRTTFTGTGDAFTIRAAGRTQDVTVTVEMSDGQGGICTGTQTIRLRCGLRELWNAWMQKLFPNR